MKLPPLLRGDQTLLGPNRRGAELCQWRDSILEPTMPPVHKSTQIYWIENHFPMFGDTLVGKDAMPYKVYNGN